MEKEKKTERIYSRPDAESFEEFKAWFNDFCDSLGIKGEISDQELLEAWESLSKARASKKAEEEKNEKK